jgi:hypothetical protein
MMLAWSTVAALSSCQAFTAEPAQSVQLSEWGILAMYFAGVIAIAVAWVYVVHVAAKEKVLNELISILRQGHLIQFVTITYIIIVIVTLGLIGKLESSHVSTLLGAIAGYVLGQRSSEAAKNDKDKQDPKGSNESQPK